MLEYVYIVKCPSCEDEHFYFFDEAKERAMGQLTKKPIIIQVEVTRNDFGECTGSCDLGTVWSWEEMMTDDAPAKPVFTKDDLKCADCDAEFDELDNSVDDFRRPVPDNMSIEDLVEAMEENEDEVECALCNELFPKAECHYDEEEGYICAQCEEETVKCTWCGFHYDPSECRKEADLGWLCSRCEMAIKSRGETLTFIEGNYWDFLDESIPAEWFANCVDHSDMEIWGLEPVQDDIYEAVLLKRFKNVSYRGGDETQKVTDEMYDIDGAFTFGFGKDGLPSLHSWNINLLRKLGSIIVDFKDGRYEDAAAKVFSRSVGLSEAIDPSDLVELEYPELTATLFGTKRDVDDWDESEYTDSHVFLVPKVEVATAIWENWITEEDVMDVEGGLDTLEDDIAWEKFLETHFDDLFEKYNKQILEYFKDEATEDFRERSQEDYDLERWSAKNRPVSYLEDLETPDAYAEHLADCPECGVTQSFDHETGICINCGFNI